MVSPVTVDGWKRFFDVASVALVLATFVAGAGVLWTGNIINKRQETQLREFDIRLTESKTELGKQQERAAKAEKELKETSNVAGSAILTAGEANEHAAKLESANLSLRGQIATLERDAAEQRERAAIAERELLALRQAASPRSFTDAQLKAFTSILAAGPKGSMELMFQAGDLEAAQFASQIYNALTSAGWTPNRLQPVMESVIVRGINVWVRDTNRAPVRAKTLVDAFLAADVDVTVRSNAELPENHVALMVAPKWTPPQPPK